MKSTLRTKPRRCFALCLLLTLCCGAPLRVSADTIDLSKPINLTLSFENEEDEPIEGAVFSLYYVADISDDDYILADDFAEADIDISGDVEEWNWTGLASTFESYILIEDDKGDEIEPIAEGKTEQDGDVTFTGLKAGLYLVTGDTLKKDKVEYIPGTSLISLPYLQDDGHLDYNPDIVPKYTIRTYSTPSTVAEDSIDLHAQKVWKDNSSSSRPSKVTVMLFKDGEKYDEVELNEKNSWYYSWKNLDAASRWQLGEVSVPSGYTVLSEEVDNTFVVTNTLTTEPRVPHHGSPGKPSTPRSTTPNDSIPNPDTPKETTPDTITPKDEENNSPDIPSEITEENSETPSILPDSPPDTTDISPNIPNPTNPTTLPQTGQLWWPIPLLAFGGLIALAVGIRLRRGKADEE